MKVAVIKETAPGERRVAVVPEAVPKLTGAGLEAVVETGASVCSRQEALRADVILMVGKPDEQTSGAMHAGQAVLGMLAPLTDAGLVLRLAAAGITAISLDMIPRTLPKAQPMDALSSQASIAGYKAALLGASAF